MPRTKVVRMQWVTAVTMLGCLLVPGCTTDSPTEPEAPVVARTSPGIGSGTLQVMGVVGIEDDGTGEYVTNFSVTIEDVAGAPVSEATVVFEAAFGSRTLLEDAATPGLYAASRAGYVPGSYTLSVSAGDDHLTGLKAWAPPVHSITRPAKNDAVVADTILNVQWSVPEEAQECRLTTRDYDSNWINGDTQTLWVPGVGNPPRDDQRIRVLRRNTQFSEAGLAGTRLAVSIRHTVEPIIAQ